MIWRIIGASVQGTSHQGGNVPCQDRHLYGVLDNGIALIVVADGAGSADRSADGAQCAVNQALLYLQTALASEHPKDEGKWKDLLLEAFRQAHESVIALAKSENLSARLFASTLTCVVICDEWVVAGQIGDGLAIAQSSDDSFLLVAHPDRGEYANEAFFLTMNDALHHIEVNVLNQPVKSLAVSTDGMLRLAVTLPDYIPYAPFLQPLFKFVIQGQDVLESKNKLEGFLASERVCERTDDDKTLVLAVRIPNELPRDSLEAGKDLAQP